MSQLDPLNQNLKPHLKDRLRAWLITVSVFGFAVAVAILLLLLVQAAFDARLHHGHAYPVTAAECDSISTLEPDRMMECQAAHLGPEPTPLTVRCILASSQVIRIAGQFIPAAE